MEDRKDASTLVVADAPAVGRDAAAMGAATDWVKAGGT
jgi:hypothetical protein